MPKQQHIEFRESVVTSAADNKSIVVKLLITPLDQLASKTKSIIIDDTHIDCDPATVQRLGMALRRVHALEQRGQQVDCNGLAVLLGGGTHLDRPSKNLNWPVQRSITHGEAHPVKDSPYITAMQPSILGTMHQGAMRPNHVHVKLNPDEDIWIEKLGNYSIGLAKLADVADFYSATHMAPVYDIAEIHGDRPVIHYQAARASQHAPTFTLSSITLP